MKLDVKGTQFLEPLFEFSGACTGCGETPYLKLLTQLYGDRAIIANATGCSSIFGAQPPDDAVHAERATGRGPAWANSLFEDNAEFGFGMRLAIDKQAEHARELLAKLGTAVGDGLVEGAPRGRPDRRGRHREAARAGEAPQGEAVGREDARGAPAQGRRRLPRPQVRLDRRRRRLGVRHRLRRPRPRHRVWAAT